jgi:hypothetical protein
VSAADVDMALSLPPTGGTDDTAATGGTPFSPANITAMATAGGTTYTTATDWGASGDSVVGGQQVNGVSCVSATQCWVVGANGVILATANGGTTFTAETSSTTQLLAAVSCVSTTHC